MSAFLINFKHQFAPLVESGEKRQTIRRHRKDGRRIQPGDTVKLYTGLRTRNARLLRAAEVISVHGIQLHTTDKLIVFDGQRLDPWEAADFARADGFLCVSEMQAWFEAQYGPDFEGYCVRWNAGPKAS